MLVSLWKDPKIGAMNPYKFGSELLRSDANKKRAMQDSNPRLRLRRPEGYPDYPNRPTHPSRLPFLKELFSYLGSEGWKEQQEFLQGML